MRYCLTLVIVLSSCKWSSEESSVAQVKNSTSQDIGRAVTAISGEHVCHEKVTAEDLHIDFLGAGIQTTMSGRFVRLFYSVDPKLCHDYLEIMRCQETASRISDLTCRDGKALTRTRTAAELNEILNSEHGDTVNRDGLRDCWNSIASKSICVLLGGARDREGDRTGRVYAAEHYVDASAPAGQRFYYLARVCVRTERTDELTSGNDICAQQVKPSKVVKRLSAFKNDIEVTKARQNVARIAARLNYMTERAYEITLEFSKEFDKYQDDDIARQRAKRMRQGVAMIGGMAIGAVGAVFTVGVSSIGSGLDAGQALGAAFADVIATADDYPKTCYECKDLLAELIEVIGDTRGFNFSTSGLDVSSFDAEKKAKANGLKYFIALQEYEDAVSRLNDLWKDELNFMSEQKTFDEASSRGGPLW